MDDIEAARNIYRALKNLRPDFPKEWREGAIEAYGRLIRGALGIKTDSVLVFPSEDGGLIDVISRRESESRPA